MRIRIVMLTALTGALVALPAAPVLGACHSVSFSGDPYTVGEGQASVRITVSNNGGAATGMTVDYKTVDGSAKAGSDYVTKSGTITFPGPPGDVSFDVPILNDSADEPSQQFTIELSDLDPGSCGGAQITESSATVTITDNDPKPTPKTSPTPTRSSAPRATTSTSPTPTQSATRTASASPSPTPSPSPSPTPTPTETTVAVADEGDGGLSGGAVGAIVAAAVVVGGAAIVLVRRRFLA